MNALEPVILAIDLGTTDVKAGLITSDGRLVASARRPHPMAVDAASGRAEQDPAAWWAGLTVVSRELVAGQSAPEVAAICCVGQGPTMTPVDDAGNATHPALTWMDTRPAAEAPAFEQATGLAGWGLGILPAARWLERSAPAAAANARWYLNSWEWAAFRLTGRAATTRSFGQVLPEAVDAGTAGLDASRIAPIMDAGSVVGELAPGAATELGIRAGVPVVAGTVDSFASFHGSGIRQPGDAVDTGGTSGGLAVYWDAAISAPGIWVAPAPLPGRWMIGGAMTSTGKALDWLDEQILGGVGPGAEALIAEAASVPAGAGGLVFLPYLAGERSPIWDPLARGAFIGLTLEHGRAHLARAVLEAAALALRHVATPIRQAGVRIDNLRVTGGTARGDTWNQIKADVLGVPVDVPAVRETAILGAAILAAIGIGWQTSAFAAIDSMVRIDHRLEPDLACAPIYAELFEAYAGAWPAIAPIVHRLHELPPAG